MDVSFVVSAVNGTAPRWATPLRRSPVRPTCRRRWAVKGGEAVTCDPERQRRTLDGPPVVAHLLLVGSGGQSGCGVGGGMDGGQAFGGHPGVDVGRGEVPVTEQLLDVADVGPPFDHEGGRRVAEQVAAPGLARARDLYVVVDLSGEPGGT